MAYRVAIAISGAVSLGSYEAGVVYELINAIGQHNAYNRNRPEKQIHIDVLSGASAGGMTATILAQKLRFSRDSLAGPYTNDLYKSWVKDVNIDGLLSDRFGDNPTQALLSSNFVHQVAEQVLLGRYRHEQAPLSRPHLAAAKEIHVALALSNLNGVDYAVDAFKNASLNEATGKFIQTRYQDSFTRVVNEQSDHAGFWRAMSHAACACGAFPTAFAPQELLRNYAESDYPPKAMPFGSAHFAYVDGGTFNNYPLGMAKNLVNRLDQNPRDNESRYYFYISPNSKNSTKSDFNASKANPLNTTLAMTSAIFNQARFQDWILTSHYNDLLGEMDEHAEALCEYFLQADSGSVQAIEHTSDVFLERLFNERSDRHREQENHVLHERYRLQPYAQRLLQERGEHTFAIWIKAIQVFEFSAHLQNKDKMQIYTITSAPEELASDAMFAFIGFMEERFRDHDYNVGRRKAREMLTQLQAVHRQGTKQHEHHLPLADFEFEDSLPDLPDLGNAHITDVQAHLRDDLRKRIRQRLNLWLKNEGMCWFLRKPTIWFANKKLKQHLHL